MITQLRSWNQDFPRDISLILAQNRRLPRETKKSAKLKKCTKLTAATFEAITAAKSSQTITLTTRDCLVSIKTEWYASSIQGKSREPWRGRLAQSPGIPGQIAQFVSLICKFRISRWRIHCEKGSLCNKMANILWEKRSSWGPENNAASTPKKGKVVKMWKWAKTVS